jgi:brefeldin A-inhibited guanine nucleotide-exchange protein
LDLTQIGEVFGKEPDASFVKDKGIDPEKGGEGFYIRVLHHYVNQLDFNGVKFDDAIRLFLSGFRLPGESQKVCCCFNLWLLLQIPGH